MEIHQQKILQVIKSIEAHKSNAGIHPTHALYSDVTKAAGITNEHLDEMERQGLIRTGNTINSRYIHICEK